jgi:hypothetical protein
MKPGSREFWLALLAIVLITLVYLGVTTYSGAVPAASQFFGHSLGVFGIVLMAMTETLYSLRKRTHSIRWGRMSSWLQFHIFTGLVGPYMALLHTSWKFNGLAGVLMLLTVIIVISGFIGRYIYTAVPRTIEGAEVEVGEINQQLAVVEQELAVYLEGQSESARQAIQALITQTSLPVSSGQMVFGRVFMDNRLLREWSRHKRQMDHLSRSQVQNLDDLLRRRIVLHRQAASLDITRHLLATWHTVHIPIGMALFTVAFIHMLATLYLATFLH